MSVSLDYSDLFVSREKENLQQHLQQQQPGNALKSMKMTSDEPVTMTDEGSLEKFRLRDQLAIIAAENDSLRYQILTLQREKDRDAQLIESLRQEVSMGNTRIGSLIVEQRELRNHWMQEKSELDGKMFQLQALQTQIQGTMRKKEKEFEKLQGHLQKQVKDSTRGQKTGVVMSKPAPKNSSQVKSAPGAYLLRDAELTAVNATVAELVNENTTLRNAIAKLDENTTALQSQFTSSLAQLTSKYQREQETLISKIRELQELQRELDQQQPSSSSKRALPEELGICVTEPVASTAVSPMKMVSIQESEASCLLAASVKKRKTGFEDECDAADPSLGNMMTIATATTPCAKPAGWVAEKVATGLKQLQAALTDSLQVGMVENMVVEHVCSIPPTSAMKRSSMGDEVARLKRMSDEVDRLRAELASAMSQIHAQDKLIHQALIGQLPGLDFNVSVDVEMEEADWSSATSREGIKTEAISTMALIETSPTKEDLDFMPPASPATKALLESFGWNVPQRMDPQSARKSRLSM